MAAAVSVFAQAPRTPPAASELIRLRGVSAETTFSPDFSYSLRGRSTQRDGRANWLKVEAEFATAPNWIDEITFTFYVVLRGNANDLPEGARENNLFSGTVTYIHVPQSRRMVANMFLDPNTLARYGQPTYTAVVVAINGEPAARMADPAIDPEEPNLWWSRETPNEVPLLSRKETPFALVEHDHLPTIKP
jgi:hypothetical protein